MGKTYRECPACGKHALSIATRCPACGQALLDEPVRRQASPERGRLGPVLVVVAVLLVAGGLVVQLVRRGPDRGPDATATAEVRAETPVAVETRAAVPSVLPAVADSAPSAEAVARVARTWTKVHARRSVNGELTAVLLPGDTVLADSLRGSWLRVALEGRVIGYVYAPTLVETP